MPAHFPVPFLGVRAVAVHHEQQNDRRLLGLLRICPDKSLQRFGGLSAVGVVHPVFHDNEVGTTVKQLPLRPAGLRSWSPVAPIPALTNSIFAWGEGRAPFGPSSCRSSFPANWLPRRP